ncbi:transketolase [Pholiota molesta]|nr:transketolase [Pholiota molesta]
MSAFTQQDELAIATIRTLAVDTVAKANSGHPGAPMGMAPSHTFLNANPKNSKWFNRDRFVLSNGCALQYVLLHLLGYKLSLDDLKAFRQLDSKTPGHPEAGHTDGIEVTTGPLGQGFANGVGLAIAQAHLAAVYNKDGFDLINNYTYVFTGDGCLMEGVASEAASLGGHLQLGNLIVVHISIDGDTAVAFTENVEQRFLSYGWQVLHVDNGDTDLVGISNAIAEARQEKNKPTLIRLRTTIGYGSKQQGTHGVHGAPLKADDIVALKTKFGFNPQETFAVPQAAYDLYSEFGKRGIWQKYPNEYAELTRRIAGELPTGWEKTLPVYKPTDAAQASRKLSEIVLTSIIPLSLTSSVKSSVDFQPPSTGLGTYAGTYIRYGVREHGMAAIGNGLAAYGGIIPFVATFLNFVSYASGAVRLSALSGHQVIWVATHDSIGLGEDGPTHQPVETGIALRATPNNLPNLVGSSIEKAAREEHEDLTIVSTGSEVSIAVEAANKLKAEGIKTRVVSLPCWLTFDQQDEAYRLSVLRSGAPILSLEAFRLTAGWEKYSHEQYGLPAWGASGPYLKVYEKFGITGSKSCDFYKKKGGEVVSPLVKAFHL